MRILACFEAVETVEHYCVLRPGIRTGRACWERSMNEQTALNGIIPAITLPCRLGGLVVGHQRFKFTADHQDWMNDDYADSG